MGSFFSTEPNDKAEHGGQTVDSVFEDHKYNNEERKKGGVDIKKLNNMEDFFDELIQG